MSSPTSRGNQVSSESLIPTQPVIDMQRIAALATRAGSMVEQIRSMLLAPEARKISPTYSTAQLASLCGVDKAHVAYRITKDDLPGGQLTPSGGKRTFKLDEIRRWTRTSSTIPSNLPSR